MYNSFTIAFKYLQYWFRSSNGKGHGVHSPFVFDFITAVLNDKGHYYAYEKVEYLRAQLCADTTTIEVEDMGAGSNHTKSSSRSIASIAKRAAKPPKYGQLLFRMANHYQPKNILELGTSLGITSAYLAFGAGSAKMVTIEGSPAIAEKAQANFRQLGLKGIHSVCGNFDNVLPQQLKEMSSPDFVFIDGNHRLEPTLRYFDWLLQNKPQEGVYVFDDIHWSAEMEEAWDSICKHPEVFLTIDLFFIGLVFFNPSFKVKQHFSIRF